MDAKDQQSFVETRLENPLDKVCVWSAGIQPTDQHTCVSCDTEADEVLVLSTLDWIHLVSLQIFFERHKGHLKVDNTRWQNAAFAHIGLCAAHRKVGVALQQRADTRGVLDEEDVIQALSAAKS